MAGGIRQFPPTILGTSIVGVNAIFRQLSSRRTTFGRSFPHTMSHKPTGNSGGIARTIDGARWATLSVSMWGTTYGEHLMVFVIKF